MTQTLTAQFLPASNGVKETTNNSVTETSDKPWQFKKGNSLSNGRPKGQRDFTTELLESLKRVEKKVGKKILDHAWEQALTDNKVLMGMLRKIAPDLPTDKDGEKPKQLVLIYGHVPGQLEAYRKTIELQPVENGAKDASSDA